MLREDKYMVDNISIKDWKALTLTELLKKYDISIEEMYDIALKKGLYNYVTPIERRNWTKEDANFIKRNKNFLSVREVSCIMHKTYYATLQKVKLLGLYEMINK